MCRTRRAPTTRRPGPVLRPPAAEAPRIHTSCAVVSAPPWSGPSLSWLRQWPRRDSPRHVGRRGAYGRTWAGSRGGSRRAPASGAVRRALRRPLAPVGEGATDADGGRRTTGAACPARRGTGARRRRPGSGAAVRGSRGGPWSRTRPAPRGRQHSCITPTGENPRKLAKLGRVHTIGRRGLPGAQDPRVGTPGRPFVRSRGALRWPSSSSGTARGCWRGRTARHRRSAPRRGRASGHALDAPDARDRRQGTRSRAGRRGGRSSAWTGGSIADRRGRDGWHRCATGARAQCSGYPRGW